MSLPPWRPLLRGARQREGRSPQARWLQLATLGTDGAPRVRTLVFRGWGGPAQLDLLTDRRSSKSEELKAEPRVELCWLLPGARSLWGWPEPGAHLDAGATFPAEVADGTPLPDCFELVRIAIDQVELLELTGHPHQRRRWRADQGWSEERLNP